MTRFRGSAVNRGNAEAVAAAVAVVVVEDGVVDDFTKHGADGASGGASTEAAQHGSGDTSQQGACGANPDAEDGTDFCTGEDAADAAGGTCCCANGAANFTADVAGAGAGGLASRAVNGT